MSSDKVNLVNFIVNQLIGPVILVLRVAPAINKVSSCVCTLANILHSIEYAKQKQPGAIKKGAAKQSRIKRIIWHLRWLVRTRADISLRPGE